jgi:hypothetical protein
MHIWAPSSFGFDKVPLFQLYFVPDLSLFLMLSIGPENVMTLARADLGIRCLQVASAVGANWRFAFPVSGALTDELARHRDFAYHPFRRLRRRIFRISNGPLSSLQVFLSPDLAVTLAMRARNALARNNLGLFLADMADASVKILYSETPGTKMLELGNGQFLYSLTLVFPWALAVLALPPNCAMTDTTFKCVRPYTLAILHAIVANTSIPLAFGIAPSESAGSYIRIYEHIHDIMERFHPELMNAPLVNQLRSAAPPQPVLDEGFFEVPDDLPEAQDDEVGPPVPGPDMSSQVVDQPLIPQSFRPPERAVPVIVEADRVDDDEHDDRRVEAKQAMQDETSVVIPADDDAIETVLQPLGPDPIVKRTWLTWLPIVTDLGVCLAALVAEYQLDWKLCIRHILETLGGKGQIVDWARRLLYSFCLQEYLRNCAVIQAEIKLLNARPKKLYVL